VEKNMGKWIRKLKTRKGTRRGIKTRVTLAKRGKWMRA
jgi:hypothetical protein